MARGRDNEVRSYSGGEPCDLCHEKRGRNRIIVHILEFKDEESLSAHLNAVFTESKYCVEFYSTLWSTAHSVYGSVAREKYVPLWLVYLEEHGVKVKNRSEMIMRYRGARQGAVEGDD